MSTAINYQALEENRTQGLQNELEQHLADELMSPRGSIDNLRNTVMGCVVSGQYELAASELNRYIDLNLEYPTFRVRTERYVQHCVEIIEAIKMKRNFPGISSLSLSKQQELFERVKDHFNELKEFLKKIEYIDRELRLDDMKSTVWTIRSFAFVVTMIFVVAFTLELFYGIGHSISVVYDDLATRALNLIL